MNKALKTYFVDTTVGCFWSWLLLSPVALLVWRFSPEQFFTWSWTAVPIWLVIGRPYVWLVLKSRTRLLKEKPQSL